MQDTARDVLARVEEKVSQRKRKCFVSRQYYPPQRVTICCVHRTSTPPYRTLRAVELDAPDGCSVIHRAGAAMCHVNTCNTRGIPPSDACLLPRSRGGVLGVALVVTSRVLDPSIDQSLAERRPSRQRARPQPHPRVARRVLQRHRGRRGAGHRNGLVGEPLLMYVRCGGGFRQAWRAEACLEKLRREQHPWSEPTNRCALLDVLALIDRAQPFHQGREGWGAFWRGRCADNQDFGPPSTQRSVFSMAFGRRAFILF